MMTPPPVMKLDPPDPPKYYGPFDARAKLMNLQNLALEQQEGQQKLQIGQQTLDENKRLLAQRQAIDQAYKDAVHIDENGAVTFDDGQIARALALSNNGSVVPGLMEGHAKYKKSLFDLRDSQGKVAALEQDTAGSFGAMVKAAQNEPHLFLTMGKQAVHSGAITQEHFQPLFDNVTAALAEDPTGEKARALVGQYADLMIAGSTKQQQLATSRMTAESTAARNKSQGNLADVKTLQGQMQIGAQTMPVPDPQTGTIDPQAWSEWRAGLQPAVQAKIAPKPSPAAVALVKQMGLTPDQLRQGEQAAATLEEAKARNAQTASHEGVLESQGGQRLAIERGNAKRMQDQFDATYGALLGPNGEQLSPDAMKAVAMQDPAAVAVANYQIQPPTMSRGGPGAAVLRKVLAINPNYNAQNWGAQKNMMERYTSGPQSKEISGINTSLGHVATLGEAIDALKNTDVQALNRMANFLGVQTGGDAVTTFRAIVHKVAPEISRAYVGGVGSQGEILSQESDFDPKLGDKQLRSNVAITAKLLRSKIGSLENQWKQTMGSDFNARFMMPEAQRAIEKWAPEGGTTQTAPSGGRGGGGGAKASGLKVGDSVMYQGRRHKITAIDPATGKLTLEQ